MAFLLSLQSMGSMIATIMLIQTAVRNFLPPWLQNYISEFFSKFIGSLKPSHAIVVEEFDNGSSNDLYDAVQLYFGSKFISSPKVLKFSKHKNSPNINKKMGSNQSLEDIFQGAKVEWLLKEMASGSFGSSARGPHYRGQEGTQHSFRLSFHRKDKEMIHDVYIPHIMEVAEDIRFKNRQRKLYTNRMPDQHGRSWSSVPFSHPSTFETMAMNPVLKTEIQEDLKRFMRRKDFYDKVGRAWKRGYLLYGPPGTGKTSLIAAIANFLEFDIYDLELTAVLSNSQLRNLLINTTSKSVIVVEDIDCSLDLSGRKKQVVNIKEKKEGSLKPPNASLSTVSLSGVLNFADGLWSSCAGERLMIFTTNHKEKLDPALLRAGRMDKHINLSYCEIGAFKMLAKNYLGIEEHEMMKEVEELLPLVKITPADITEIFLDFEDNEEIGIVNVVEEMKKRMARIEEKVNDPEQGSPNTVGDDEILDDDVTGDESSDDARNLDVRPLQPIMSIPLQSMTLTRMF